MTRTRHVGTPADLSDAVAEYRADGYALKRQGTRSARLARRDHGGIGAHLLVFLVLGWWSVGLFNVAYALFRRYYSYDEVEVCVRGD